jgi:hypothetical protein
VFRPLDVALHLYWLSHSKSAASTIANLPRVSAMYRTRSFGGSGGFRRTGCLRLARKFAQVLVGATSRWTPGESGWFTHVIKADQHAIMAV